MIFHSRKPYFRGIAWFVTSLVICESNDVVTKYLGHDLSSLKVVFGRFFFGSLVLLPLMIRFRECFKTRYLWVNFIRGLILFLGMLIWCHGLDVSQLSVACLINFTTPMFTLILAVLILREKLGKPRIIATIVGFIGVAFALNPRTASFPVATASLFLLSAILFATLDIVNKILITREKMLTSLFYTGIFTLLLAGLTLLVMLSFDAAGTSSIFQMITHEITSIRMRDVGLLMALGVGENLLMFCTLKSFSYIDVSATAPFRYVELILASILGYLFFGETIALNTVLGALIIIPSVIYLVRFEAKASNISNTPKHQITPTHCC
jgi:S-adenosylmethionine uptake transporter